MFDSTSTARTWHSRLLTGLGEPKWYPGADVVDWFSIDLFTKNDAAAAWTEWFTPYFAELAKAKYLHAGELSQLKDYGLYK